MTLILSQLHPLSLRRHTGYMDYCQECGDRYRRMSFIGNMPICGACTIPRIARPSAIAYADASSSRMKD